LMATSNGREFLGRNVVLRMSTHIEVLEAKIMTALDALALDEQRSAAITLSACSDEEDNYYIATIVYDMFDWSDDEGVDDDNTDE
jgi:hypothetical protein